MTSFPTSAQLLEEGPSESEIMESENWKIMVEQLKAEMLARSRRRFKDCEYQVPAFKDINDAERKILMETLIQDILGDQTKRAQCIGDFKIRVQWDCPPLTTSSSSPTKIKPIPPPPPPFMRGPASFPTPAPMMYYPYPPSHGWPHPYYPYPHPPPPHPQQSAEEGKSSPSS